jgi:hypothetical protein
MKERSETRRLRQRRQDTRLGTDLRPILADVPVADPLDMSEFRKKQLAVLLIADTLNPIAIMDLAETLKQLAFDRDDELYDGSQFKRD